MRTRQPESSLAAHASQINVHCSQSVKSELPFSVLKRLALKGSGVGGGGWGAGAGCFPERSEYFDPLEEGRGTPRPLSAALLRQSASCLRICVLDF